MTKSTRTMLALLATAALASPAHTTPRPPASRQRAARPATQPRPNILLILVDDLKPALRSFGDSHAISPNIDRLAARGVRFQHAYANQAVCAPSRINLMTGRRSTSTGIYHFGMDLRDYVPNAVTLPQLFRQAGYTTQSIGKVFHVGHGSFDDRASWSVPSRKDKVIEYRDPASTDGRATREEVLFNEVPFEGAVFEAAAKQPRGAAWESPDVPDEAYADGRTARFAGQRLRELKAAKSPFFLAVGFARPHLPFAVPKRYWDLYDPAKLPQPASDRLPAGAPDFAGKVKGEIAAYTPLPASGIGADIPPDQRRKLIHGYYAGVSYVDAQIGKLLDALDREGLAKDTIVILWGDHGFHLGDHGLWTKHTNYEQAVRLPLILAGPGTGRAGAAPAQLAETVDIYPTLVRLAGLRLPATMQPLDGTDLGPVLRDARRQVRPYAYHAFNRPGRIGQAIRADRYRLIRWTKEATGERIHELYDLRSDPGETRNIAREQPVVRARLDAWLDAQPKPVSVDLPRM